MKANHSENKPEIYKFESHNPEIYKLNSYKLKSYKSKIYKKIYGNSHMHIKRNSSIINSALIKREHMPKTCGCCNISISRSGK